MPVDLQAFALSKSFAGERVVREVSFAVREGEIVSILGPSGCGKTTLLRMVAGLERPDAGRMTLGDRTVYRDRPFAWTRPEDRGIGMVFQDFGLWPHLTVRQNVAFALRFGRRRTSRPAPREVDDRVSASLETLRIGSLAEKLPHQLSGGQQQRVAFARATAARPQLLLLDEPFNALDAQLRVRLREELLSMLRRDRFTVLHVTHDQEEALTMSDRILAMSRGRILQYDTPENLYRRPEEAAVAALVGRANLIPVQVEAAAGAAIRLRLPDRRTVVLGEAVHGVPRGVSDDTPMAALVRPEDVALAAAPPGDGGGAAGRLELAGTVDSVQFLGDRYAVRVSVPGVGPLLCYAAQRVGAGVRVSLHVPLDRLRLLPCGDEAAVDRTIRSVGKVGASA